MGGGPRDRLGGPSFNLCICFSGGGRSWKLLRGLESRLWVSSSHLDHLIWLTEHHGLLVLARALLFLEKRL